MPFYTDGLGPVPPDLAEQSRASFLCTAKLAETIAQMLSDLHELVVDHRDRFLDHPDAAALDHLLYQASDYSTGLGIMAANARMRASAKASS